MAKKKPRPRLQLNQMQKAEAEKAVGKYFNALLAKKYDEWKRQIMLDDRRALTALVFLVLHDNFGFGEQRLKRFDDAITAKMKDVTEGYLTLKDIYDWFDDELGMKFDLATANPADSIVLGKEEKTNDLH